MPVNTSYIQKTQCVKESLEKFLNKLKEINETVEQLKSYIFTGCDFKPYVYEGDIKTLNEGISTLEEIYFVSVNEFASVKRLRKAELFFSKTRGLKEFSFPNYKSQINPACLRYVEIELQLDSLEKKSQDLACRGYRLEGRAVKHMVTLLRGLNHLFFNEERISYYDYRARALAIINQIRSVLEQHRGFKQLLGNLVLLILTLGTAFIINKAVNGQFLFFQKTDSAQKLDDLTQTVSQLSLS